MVRDIEMHQMEGTGCHAAALNWLAFRAGWQEAFALPEPPERHRDAGRWQQACANGLKGAQAWFEKREVVPLLIEQPSANWVWGIAGCPDLLCHLTYRGQRVCAIVELKFTAKLILSHRVQLRLYRKLQGYEAGRMGFLVRISRDDGRYEEKPLYWGEEPELDALALQMANKLR